MLSLALMFSLITASSALTQYRKRKAEMLALEELKNSRDELTRSETKFRTLYDSTSDAVWLLDENGFIDCNKAALELFGSATKEALKAKSPSDLSPRQQTGGIDSRTLASQRMASAFEKGSVRFEWLHQKVDSGQTFPAEVLMTAMELDGRRIIQAVVRDITDRKAAEDEIRHLAFYDHLTQLPNRRLMVDRLGQALTSSARHGRQGALMMIDLDNFKTLNDTLGHDVGDQLLVEAAFRLKSCIRQGDTVPAWVATSSWSSSKISTRASKPRCRPKRWPSRFWPDSARNTNSTLSATATARTSASTTARRASVSACFVVARSWPMN
jgi:PAS domain S-box-containing protein